MSKLMFLLFIACTLISTPSFADVRLPKILSSHMVLQRNADVKIWGWADPGETIVIKADWIKAELNTTADTNKRTRAAARAPVKHDR